ncbi:hypothetical protein ACTA71_007337 [Dictyostelium dimigraforme]
MSTNNSTFHYEWKSSSIPIKKEPLDEQEYNILLLGVTGSGKSTFINSAYNYLNFSSLEEAIVKGDINKMFMIPTKINMTDSKSINYSFSINGSSISQSNEIGNKSDENYEVNQDEIKIGESVTRVPKKYPLVYNGRLFNFIDTCGIGDTRGIQQDSINFELILAQISQLKYLHGICIFMKPNDSRSTILYKWCLNELLTKLHHSAKDNIMFCFPNSRGTFFRSGDSQLTLKNYLQQLKLDLNIDIENCNSNCNLANSSLNSREFYFDNDALHFLAVKSQGGYFDQSEQAQYHYSWTKSSVSLKRLLTKIQTIQPHDVRNTISINYAREMILQLAKPMSVCLKNINDNLNEINKHKKKLRKSLHQVSLNQNQNITIGNGSNSFSVNDSISKELQESLFIPIIQVTSMPLSRPKAVCINSFCIEKEKYKMSKQIELPSSSSPPSSSVFSDLNDESNNTNTNTIRFCCENCFGGLLGNLYLCFSYDVNGKCKSCYKSNGSLCHHSDHIIIKSIESNNQIKNQPQQQQSNDNIEKIKENTNQLIKQLKERKRLYEKEFQEISNASVHFSLFLSKNSLIQVNNEYESFINLQISNEKSQDSIKILVKHLQDYKIQVDSQRKAIESGKTKLKTAKEIIELVNEIKNLQLVGHIINSIQLTNNSSSTIDNQNEIIIQKSITTKKIITNFKNKLI